jgi:hypothetical protein
VKLPLAGRSDQAEDASVVVIDLRACAGGPDAADAGGINERTLEERQRRDNRGADRTAEWRLVNFERLLVVDDTAEFTGHEDSYRYLIEAPTFGRMLCVLIGAPSEPPYLDLPKAAEAARVPVLWIGDSRGVGWRIGWANTTRLAFSDTDPDGSVTVANFIDLLRSPAVFDQTVTATSGLSDRIGAPALLPWVRWPLPDPDAATPDHEAHDDCRASWWRFRRAVNWLLLVLGCAVIVFAAQLAIRFSRTNVDYLIEDAGVATLILLVLLVIAYRLRVIPPSLGLAEATPFTVEAPSEDVLSHARWMLTASVAEDAFRQLTSPEQLIMLGGDLDMARLVRFAPQSARALVEPAIEPNGICWIPDSDQLGVIRLVPIKAGLVRQRSAWPAASAATASLSPAVSESPSFPGGELQP